MTPRPDPAKQIRREGCRFHVDEFRAERYGGSEDSSPLFLAAVEPTAPLAGRSR
jgi:hypothetical protein